MPYSVALMRKLEVLDPDMKELQWAILDEIEQHREVSVTKNEFNELKEIVRELGQTTKRLTKAQERTELRMEALAKAQERTELRMEGLAKAQERTEQNVENLSKAMERLAKAQERTELRMEGLAKAQERTEQKVENLSKAMEGLAKAQERTEQKMESLSGVMAELAEAQKQTEKEMAKLSGSLHGTRGQVGGLARSMAYALENEAFRKLPELMRTLSNLDIREKIVRTFIRGEEINVFAKARRNGEEVMVVGEAVLRLDDRLKMAQLEKNTEAVREEYGLPVVPLIITHFAHPDILRKAREQGVLVVQSFEWE